MTKRFIIILFSAIATLTGCSTNGKTQQNTLFFFYPWSTNLTHYFKNNIVCFESALTEKNLKRNRIIVFISQSKDEACMYEIKMKRGKCIHDTIAQFNSYNYEYTSVDGLSDLLKLAKGSITTPNFAMIIGCHGDAWIPARDMKRSFGGVDIESRIDISTLRNALKKTNITAEYILFDDCYMSSIEVAYELRNVCKYLIASPAEIMAAGMPFADIAQDLLDKPNYEAICNDFYNYYANNSSTPYGTIAVTNCQELDKLANIVKEINTKKETQNITSQIQFYDGYNPHLFYDLGNYITTICNDDILIKEFNSQMQQCIIYKAHTPKAYAYGFGTIDIENYSGISTSAPSTNPKATSYNETEWYKNTH